ncbi:uncharacterized protein F4807DRAFT_450735 [Annulohypoxylon truncatum]|uniref:uncharacterized protein n=1 Tax=Annulohypoxylon truncatum TaxID=327061 RepID=UPI0020081BAD|nr:uncharacterized protein F4807DRAFT_450735 [Annulohypoxylon truncatum]KAI1211504.1 hypothetical protein F4807DRAFT_450735 [Annulohypoxylon truncatum]
MNSPTRPRPRQAQAPRDYDDGQPAIYHNSAKAAPSAPNGPRFDSHDDFYDFLDSNRGPMSGPSSLAGPSNANASTSAPLHTQPLQMPQQQQRFGQSSGPSNQSPTGTSRPPLTNSFPPQGGGAPDRSRPPSYSGSSRSEEMLVADRTRDDGRIQRQNGRRGPPEGKPVSGPRPRPPTSSSAGSSPPRNSSGYPINPQVQHAQAQSKSASASASDPSLSVPGASVGASIQRLKSPSVADCVLQPLDQKVREYNDLMNREQDEMDRLDAEIRALQERRADAETRFLEAKGKHDDYKRQYVDVERAMRGEMALPPPTPREQPAPLTRQHTRPMSLQDDDDDDDDDLALPPSSHRRINSQQSFGRSSQKMRSGGRFRFSLFGDK